MQGRVQCRSSAMQDKVQCRKSAVQIERNVKKMPTCLGRKWPGADLSCLRQCTRSGPRKVWCKRKFALVGGANTNLQVICGSVCPKIRFRSKVLHQKGQNEPKYLPSDQNGAKGCQKGPQPAPLESIYFRESKFQQPNRTPEIGSTSILLREGCLRRGGPATKRHGFFKKSQNL